MIISKDLPKSKSSREKVTVSCDFRVSDKCKKIFEKGYENALLTQKNNNGKTICLPCSRKLKASGNNNPNSRHSIPENFLEEIDDEFSAYLLGWIASDGHIATDGVYISIHIKDAKILDAIARKIGDPSLCTLSEKHQRANLALSRQSVANAASKWLNVSPGKKSHTVRFPNLKETLIKHFIRGYFDGDGCVSSPYRDRRQPRASISSQSQIMLESLSSNSNIPATINKDSVEWNGVKALDFLSWIYDEANYYLERKYESYLYWSTWLPSLTGRHGKEEVFTWSTTRKDAVKPFKKRASDSGYDLTLLDKVKSQGVVDFYDTGIKLNPIYGWYFDLVPRSSITDTGYMLYNSVGVIDRSYTGNILVPLIKVDPSAEDLKLPARIVQIIPRHIIHVKFEQVDELPETTRGSGGFGSTGK
jgi:dUTP pyrophosphatase